jgi:hypothetical protein
MSFRETGNKVPISTEELIKYVHFRLLEFDAIVSEQKSIPSFNPYVDEIIYKTKEGKTIKIPVEIQKQAIDMLYQQTGKNIPTSQQMPQTQPRQQMKPTRRPKLQKKVIYVYEEDNNPIKLGILIFAAILALYLFFKINSDSQSSPYGVNTEKLRYYLAK